MSQKGNQQWCLAQRPIGHPKPEDFIKKNSSLPEPGEGEVLLRVLFAAMDPAIRNFLNEGGGYRASVPLGNPVPGIVLGRVERTNSASLNVGDLVFGFGSWSEFVVTKADQLSRAPVDLSDELSLYTHVLGTIGLTAHYGLIGIGGLQAGETVLVSAASGAVGSLVGQLAKLHGASRVVGFAGGPEKCRMAVERYGYDACIDYKAEPDLREAVRREMPDGIDLVFEGVGGECLSASLENLRKNARIALCGLISQYNAQGVSHSPDLWNLIVHTAQIRAFRVADILIDAARIRSIFEDLAKAISAGVLRYDVDVREGFDAIPSSFGDLFTGNHRGRLVVRIAK